MLKNIKKSKTTQKTILTIIGILFALVISGTILNISVLIRLNGLEKEIENEKSSMFVKIEEEVNKSLKNPLSSSVDNSEEDGILINTDKILTDEQMDDIVEKVTNTCESYLSNDVYMGLKELVMSDLQDKIKSVVEKETMTLSKEEREVLVTSIQESVTKEVNSSLEKMETKITSTNKVVSTLETNFTTLKGRVDKLDTSVNNSINDLKSRTSSLESQIASLKVSFVSANTGTADVKILKSQMQMLGSILNDASKTINSSLDADEATKAAYAAQVTTFQTQLSAIESDVDTAISSGSSTATESLATKAASLVTQVVAFSKNVDLKKFDLDTLKQMITDNTNLIADKQSQITLLKKEQEDLEKSQLLLSKAQTAMDDAISGKISAEEAMKQINDSIGSLDGYGSVAEKISKIVNDLENADVTNKQAALEKAETEVAKLKTTLEAQMANDKKALEDTQATLASKTELTDMSNGINAIIGDIGENTTVSDSLKSVSNQLETKAKEITTSTQQAISSLQEETDADLSSLTTGQNTLQSYINSLGTGADNDVLKAKLQKIEDDRIAAVNAAKQEAETKVNELNTNLSAEVTNISKALDTTNTSLTKAKEDLQAEINKQITELEKSTGKDLTDAKTDLQSYINGLTGDLSEEDESLKTSLLGISQDCATKVNINDVAGAITSALTDSGSIGSAIATKLGAVQSLLETSITNTANDASSDATTKANAAFTKAKGILETESVRIQGLIDKNETAIKENKEKVETLNNSVTTLSNTKANKTDVDAAITGAVKQAEDKDTAIKNAAASDATTKANAAVTSAVKQAEDKINEEMSGVIKGTLDTTGDTPTLILELN